jgi:hypothetical protein
MRKWFSDKRLLLKEILWQPGVALMITVYGLLQLVSNFITWTRPVEDQARYQFIQLVTWRVWMIATPILTVILIALIIRNTLRVISKRDAEHKIEVDALSDGFIGKLNEKDKMIKDKETLIGVLNIASQDQTERFKKEINELQDKISELNKYQLQFDIKGYKTRFKYYGHEGTLNAYEIIVDANLRFENSAAQSLRIKNVYISLCEKNEIGIGMELKQGTTTMIEGQKWTVGLDDGISVPSADVLSRAFKFDLFLPPGAEKELTQNHFLRITMEAMNQPLFYKDLDIDWGKLREAINADEINK